MSSLWTPDGERPIRRSPEPSATAAPTSSSTSSPSSSLSDAPHEGRAPSAEEAAEMEELIALQEELAKAPAADVIANHCFGLFQLAALHLSQVPPRLSDAQLAIDALGAVVDALRGRLGPEEQTLADGLAQIRIAFVQIKSGGS